MHNKTAHHEKRRHATRLPAVALVAMFFATGADAVPAVTQRSSTAMPLVDARLYAASGPTPSVTAVGIGSHPTGRGYWIASTDGRVLGFGRSTQIGPTTRLATRHPVVAIARAPRGSGYWIVTSAGRVLAFGDARNRGSIDSLRLDAPIVSMAATPSGRGYWLAARDGGVFALGDAKFRGSAGNLGLRTPIVGIVSSRLGNGYYLASADGGVYAFGDASFHGSATKYSPAGAVVDIAPSRTGRGYWLVTRDGSVYAFGDATYHGGLGGRCPGIAVTGLSGGPLVRGYWITLTNGHTFAFSPSVHGKGTCGGTRQQRAARDIFMRANAERAARGLKPLRWDDGLAAHAKGWSAEMARTGFRHSDLRPLMSGSPPRFNMVAENIGWGRGTGVTSSTMHSMWMRSDGHRQNMLNPALEAIGVGVACGPEGSIWATQNFGRYWSSGAGPPASMPAAGSRSSYAGNPVAC